MCDLVMGYDQALFAANVADTDNQAASGPIVESVHYPLTKRNPQGFVRHVCLPAIRLT